MKEAYLAAITAYRESLTLGRSLSAESEEVAVNLNWLANAEKASGALASAERNYRESLRVARAVGYDQGVATSTSNLAALARAQKDWPEAQALALEALSLSEKLGRQGLIASNCLRIAQPLVRQGKAAEALPFARRAVEIFTRLGHPDLELARATLRECES